MTIEEIETFLMIIETGTMSSAADRLYVGQSTVSSRLQSLENELHVQLFTRKKGQRSIALTTAGENFVPIAHQWQSLWRNTMRLETNVSRQEIRIASIDLINNYTFVPLYKQLIDQYPDICLNINTHHSDEIYDLVSSYTADLGFVFRSINLSNIISRPVYREKMYLLCRNDAPYQDQIRNEDLRGSDEIYLNWGGDYELWHNTFWPNRDYVIRVNTGSLIETYLNDSERHWAIVPKSLVEVLKRNEDLRSVSLQSPPPPRICYMLTNRYPQANHQKAIAEITQALNDFIQNSPDICAYEPWMLRD